MSKSKKELEGDIISLGCQVNDLISENNKLRNIIDDGYFQKKPKRRRIECNERTYIYVKEKANTMMKSMKEMIDHMVVFFEYFIKKLSNDDLSKFDKFFME